MVPLSSTHRITLRSSTMRWLCFAAVAVGLTTVLPTVYADEYFQGDATAYTLGRTDAGNCNMMKANSDASDNYAAINNVQWDTLHNCGRCAEVSCADARCPNQAATKIVQILDRCPECAHGDLDLSPSVFSALTGSSPSRYKIRWRFVDCPTVQGPIKYCLKAGSNPFWTAVQPTNVVSGVTSLTINGRATTMLGSAYYYLFDGQGATQTDLSAVKITMTSVNGETLHDTVSLSDGACTDGSSQFARGGKPVQTPAAAPTSTAPSTETPTTTDTPVSSSPLAVSSLGSSNGATPVPTTTAPFNLTASLEDAVISSTPSPSPSQSRSPAPSPSAPSTNDGGNVREAVTRGNASVVSTSPTVIVLSCCGAIATIALIAVAVIARNKKIEEKRRDAQDDIDIVIGQRAFASISTPRTTHWSDVGMI